MLAQRPPDGAGAVMGSAGYLPVRDQGVDAAMAVPIGWLVDLLGGEVDVETVPVASDTPDWTFGSFWAHPERVLDEAARNATSGFSRMDPAVVRRVVGDLRRDLANGAWDRRHGHLRRAAEYDAGRRLVITRR